MIEPIVAYDPRAEYRAHKAELDAAVLGVLERGWYVHGDEHRAFEAEFAAYCGVGHGVGVGNGTDALRIALLALGVKPGDEVVTVANAGVYPAVVVREVGALPVFVDVEPTTRTLDSRLLEAALTDRTRVVMPVHLYGQPADVDAIQDIVRPRGIKLLEDCAQAHGALYKSRRVGSLGDASAFSFYPTKNLGAYGDGGFIATDDDAVADRARLLRAYGWRRKYVSEVHGANSRLDEIQAAILRVKLRYLDHGNEERRRRARCYDEALRGVTRPTEPEWCEAVYHLYVVEVDGRDGLKGALATRGVGTDVHYPLPAHLQPAYAGLGYQPGDLPVTERLAERVLSLPMYPRLPMEHVDRVVELMNELAAVGPGRSRARHAPSR